MVVSIRVAGYADYITDDQYQNYFRQYVGHLALPLPHEQSKGFVPPVATIRFVDWETPFANMDISEDLEARMENYGNIQSTGKVYLESSHNIHIEAQ
ncbi:uncharacterized protein N7473_003770 [Penicillium subrubescens]|uniref:Uncharacterized protein n=1 Tax=Penicillium subrubescens TaxID=1316194 RepID=A0A1Q5UB06_9EURO|nr:uncharacterized protein N7473_003770 [Penicillium subrubescens]KAJ5906854.1 hypothetical protein N7473_003770 [Penicillium subrubescens]OKP09656.1 hypothetical protein PENSUB_4927 [Penicillium subrubescens]